MKTFKINLGILLFLLSLTLTGCVDKVITITEYQKVPFATFPIKYFPEANDINISSWTEKSDGVKYRVLTAEEYDDFKYEYILVKKRYNLLIDEVKNFNKNYKEYLEQENNSTTEETIEYF